MSKSHLVAIVSDIHVPEQHHPLVANFKAWAIDNGPEVIVVAGDTVSLDALSRFDMESDAELDVGGEVALAAKLVNELAQLTTRTVVIPGNHEARWNKAVFGTKSPMLKNAKGLSFKDQMYAQGLDSGVEWVEESKRSHGLYLGNKACLVRHGDLQSSRFGASNVAAKLLRETPTISTVVGHYHRAQVQCQTVLGKTVFGIANPHMSGDHGYNVSPNWQRGFTVLEFYGRSRLRDCVKFTPHLVVAAEDGSFAYGGHVYA